VPHTKPLSEGRYTLSVNNVNSDEGLPFQSFTGRYSVPFFDGSPLSAQSGSPLPCSTAAGVNTLTSAPLASPGNESGTLDFDWSANTSANWTVQVQNGSTNVGGTAQVSGSGTGYHVHLGPFTIPTGSNALTVKLTVNCPAAKVDLTNIVGARVP
jgi:hypothetical protein